MKPELEDLLKAYDAFKQAPDGPEAVRLQAMYEAILAAAAQSTTTNRELLHRAVSKFHPRWVRANLPPGFPKKLGLE